MIFLVIEVDAVNLQVEHLLIFSVADFFVCLLSLVLSNSLSNNQFNLSIISWNCTLWNILITSNFDFIKSQQYFLTYINSININTTTINFPLINIVSE